MILPQGAKDLALSLWWLGRCWGAGLSPGPGWWVKDLVLPLPWYRLQLQLTFHCWPGNVHIPQVQPKKKKKKKKILPQYWNPTPSFKIQLIWHLLVKSSPISLVEINYSPLHPLIRIALLFTLPENWLHSPWYYHPFYKYPYRLDGELLKWRDFSWPSVLSRVLLRPTIGEERFWLAFLYNYMIP